MPKKTIFFNNNHKSNYTLISSNDGTFSQQNKTLKKSVFMISIVKTMLQHCSGINCVYENVHVHHISNP